MKIRKYFLFIFSFFIVLFFNCNFSFASCEFNIPTIVYNKTVELNQNSDNIVLLYNSKTNEIYMPYQSATDDNVNNLPWTVTTYSDHFILVNPCWQFMGLYCYNLETGQFSDLYDAYVYYTGKHSSLILDDDTHPLEVIYSSRNIVNRNDNSVVYYYNSNNLLVSDEPFESSGGSSDNTEGNIIDNNTIDDNNNTDNSNWFENIVNGIGNIFSSIGSLLDYLNPFSDKFFLKDFITNLGKWFENIFNFLGSILEYLNPFSDKFLLKTLFTFLGDCLKYINPFDVDNFFGYKLVGLILDGLKALFVPADNFFDNQFGEVKQALENKLSYQSYVAVFDTLANFDETGTTELGISNYSIGGLEISQDNFLNFDFITKYKDTWFSWVRAILFIGLVIYNINQIYKIIRGTNISDGRNISSGGGKNDN